MTWPRHTGANEVVLGWYIGIRINLFHQFSELADTVRRRVWRLSDAFPVRKTLET